LIGVSAQGPSVEREGRVLDAFGLTRALDAIRIASEKRETQSFRGALVGGKGMPPLTFREVQYASAWTFLLLAGIGVLVPAGIVIFARLRAPHKSRAVVTTVGGCVAAVPFLVCTSILLFYGKMTTEVAGPEIHVRFGWLTSHAETILIAEVQQAQVVGYDALGEYGGWGIRGRGPNRALTQRGSRGVRLQLGGDRSLLIGSQRPQDLAGAIAQARQQSGTGP
jgi:hypothetical protein